MMATPASSYPAAAYPPAPPTVPILVPATSPISPTHVLVTPSVALASATTLNEFKWSDVEVDWSRPDIYRLGIGGNGEVWAGKYQRHSDVAVKISKEVTPDFDREMTILKSIRHPNVVQYIGAAESHGRWFLVTELCRYKSLQELIAAPSMRSQLTWHVRKRMLKDAALGLYHLHSKSIVHMDVKPANFFVTEHFVVKIGDLGLSKRLSPMKHGATVEKHTITHVAPETLEGKCSYPADCYSFALVMYELLTLTPPWTTAQIGPIPALFPVRVRDGLRPILPQSMPIDHKRLIEWSWHGDVSKRATMNDILTRIDSLSDLTEVSPPSHSASEVTLLQNQLKTVTQQYNDAQATIVSLTQQLQSMTAKHDVGLQRQQELQATIHQLESSINKDKRESSSLPLTSPTADEKRFATIHGTMQLCFVIDVTSSMAPYMSMVRTKCHEIMTYYTARFMIKFEVGIVAYRDYGDTKQFEVLSLTSDMRVARKFIDGLIAYEDSADADRDVPEDLVGALMKVRDLDWTEHQKQVIIMTDAPCHGRQYYDEKRVTHDNYPDGDPTSGMTLEQLVDGLYANDTGIVFVHMVHPSVYQPSLFAPVITPMIDYVRTKLTLLPSSSSSPYTLPLPWVVYRGDHQLDTCVPSQLTAPAYTSLSGGQWMHLDAVEVRRKRDAAQVSSSSWTIGQRPSSALERMITRQLCFMIDVAAYMSPYMYHVRDKCRALMEYQRSCSNRSFEVAIVVYRDHGDTKQLHEILPFTADFVKVSKYLDALATDSISSARTQSDGGDAVKGCVGLFGALVRVRDELKWSAAEREVIIWTDATHSAVYRRYAPAPADTADSGTASSSSIPLFGGTTVASSSSSSSASASGTADDNPTTVESLMPRLQYGHRLRRITFGMVRPTTITIGEYMRTEHHRVYQWLIHEPCHHFLPPYDGPTIRGATVAKF